MYVPHNRPLEWEDQLDSSMMTISLQGHDAYE